MSDRRYLVFRNSDDPSPAWGGSFDLAGHNVRLDMGERRVVIDGKRYLLVDDDSIVDPSQYDEHYFRLNEDGTTMVLHSLTCRLDGQDMNCPFDATVEKITDPERWVGDWRMTGINPDGTPVLEMIDQ